MITLQRIVDSIIEPAMLLVFSIGFLLFVYGLVEFVANPADETRRNTGKRHMLWGIVGMFVMVSVAGIIALIDDTFDLGLSDTGFVAPSGDAGQQGGPTFDPRINIIDT